MDITTHHLHPGSSTLPNARWPVFILRAHVISPGIYHHYRICVLSLVAPSARMSRRHSVTVRAEDLWGIGMEGNHEGDVRAPEEVVKGPPSLTRISRPEYAMLWADHVDHKMQLIL
jgi:hypothetical protein